MSNALKAVLLILPSVAYPGADLILMWDFSETDWADGYRVYCNQSGQTNEPISVSETKIRLSALGLQEGETVNCYVRAYRGDLETLPSESLTFTYIQPREIVLPAAPGSITITWQ